MPPTVPGPKDAQLQLSDYLRLLRRRALLIVVVTLCGVAGALLATSRQADVYRTNTQLIVSITTSGTEVVRRPVAIEQAVALGELARTPVALRAAMSAAGVSQGVAHVDASGDGASPFVNISVTGSDPVAIAAVANAFAQTLPRVQQELRQVEAGSRASLTPVRPATVNPTPVSPRPRRNLALGLGVGLALGLAGALGREALDRRLRDSGDIERLTGLPLLGAVPNELGKEFLPAWSHPRSLRAEAYRLVRTNLQFTDPPDMPSCVLVTSAAPGDGKSSLSTNLAVSCAQAGERVVVVDADLRKPSVATHFGLINNFGLSNVLAGQTSRSGAVQRTAQGTVDVLPSGGIPPNPSELLGSEGMVALISDLQTRYDRIIVDGPPVLAVADAVKLASLVTGVILVVKMGSTTTSDVESTRTTLEQASAVLLGIVANGARPGDDRAYGYGAYSGYGTTKKAPRRGRRKRNRPAPPPRIGEPAPALRPSGRPVPFSTRKPRGEAPPDRASSA